MNVDYKVLKQPAIVSQEEWLVARQELLKKEKELTKFYDKVCNERRSLPWVKIEKNYAFEGPQGVVTLEDLFDGRSQLIVQHFMFAPEWEEGCVGCSFGADHVEGALIHLENHDVTFVAISRAPISKIEAYKRRMDWNFNWVSSYKSDFNYDFNVSFKKENIKDGKVYYNYSWVDFDGEEASGMSVFYKDDSGNIYHTYSVFGRGDENGLGTYMLLDFTPKGRNENGPNFNLTDWVRHHDKYENQSNRDNGKDSCCH